MRVICRLASLVLVATGLMAGSGQQTRAATFESEVRPLLSKYCFECHGGEKTKADIDLEEFETFEGVVRSSKLWRQVLEQIREQDMPPDDEATFSDLERKKVGETTSKLAS